MNLVEQAGLKPGQQLNELQEAMVPLKDTTDNILIAAPTGSGKSAAITLFGHKYLDGEEDGIVLYVGVMKALVEQKKAEVEQEHHPWKELKKSVITGDYFYSPSKHKEINDARFIVITPESLASRIRTFRSQDGKSAWLSKVKLIIVDEIHLISDKERGGNLEAALMELTYDFPDIQLVGLSATMPNVEDLAEWFSILNGKTTHVIVSDFRPVPLDWHYIGYPAGPLSVTEKWRIEQIVRMVNRASFINDTFLIVCFKKLFAEQLGQALQAAGVEVDVHHANRPKAVRNRIEQQALNGQLRVVVATTTLTTGTNFPFDHVILTACTAAGEDIPVMTLIQAGGRAGRFGFKDHGHVWVYGPETDIDYHQDRIEKGEPILSQLLNIDILATHFLGAIYLKRINSVGDFEDWYSRTFAHYQYMKTHSEIPPELIKGLLNDMSYRGMIHYTEGMEDLSLRHRGKIAAQMLFDPYYLYDLTRNFKVYLALSEATDLDLAKAFGCCEPFFATYIGGMDRKAIHDDIIYKSNIQQGYWKSSSVYYYRLKGQDVPQVFTSLNYTIYDDIDRVQEVLVRLANECEHWDDSEEQLRQACLRVKRKLSWKEAKLAIGGLRMREIQELNRHGIFTLSEAKNNLELVKTILPYERIKALRLNYGI